MHEAEFGKVVSKRMEVCSLDEEAERLIFDLGLGTFDMGSDADRAAMRRIVSNWMRGFVFHFRNAMRKGSDAGMDQMLELMKDPDYHETVKKRRKRARERQSESIAEQNKDREKRRMERMGTESVQ